MSDDNKYGKQFLDNYLQAMGGAWRSEAEDAKLVSDPTAYAIANGLPVEEGAVVTLDRSQPDGLFTVDDAAPGLACHARSPDPARPQRRAHRRGRPDRR